MLSYAVALVLHCVVGADVPVPSGMEFSQTWDRVHFSHDLWSGVLSDHVDSAGRVDYGAIRDDARFREYLYRLSKTDPRGLASSDERKAFWINAYNAFAVQGVLETIPVDASEWHNYSVLAVESGVPLNSAVPVKSGEPGKTAHSGKLADPGKGFFRGLKFLVGGERYFLDEIEKGILFGLSGLNRSSSYHGLRPLKPDARLHMAVVCASGGCPPLAQWAFEASKLDEQLDSRVRNFTRDASRCRFNPEKRVIHLSELFNWYGKDFGNPQFIPGSRSVPDFLARYVDDAVLARSLREDPWKIEYLPYDWKLNLKSGK